MWLFNTWIYQNILNTEWFLWGIIVFVFGFNIFAPIIIFISLSEKKTKFHFWKAIKKLANKSPSTDS